MRQNKAPSGAFNEGFDYEDLFTTAKITARYDGSHLVWWW
jgi:hypothetical protein